MERRGTDCGEKEKIKEHDNNFEASYQRWKCSAHSSQVAAHLTVSLLHSTQSAQLPFLLLATLQQYLYGRTLLGQHQAVPQLLPLRVQQCRAGRLLVHQVLGQSGEGDCQTGL